jgi:hypothetical protein
MFESPVTLNNFVQGTEFDPEDFVDDRDEDDSGQ